MNNKDINNNISEDGFEELSMRKNDIDNIKAEYKNKNLFSLQIKLAKKDYLNALNNNDHKKLKKCLDKNYLNMDFNLIKFTIKYGSLDVLKTFFTWLDGQAIENKPYISDTDFWECINFSGNLDTQKETLSKVKLFFKRGIYPLQDTVDFMEFVPDLSKPLDHWLYNEALYKYPEAFENNTGISLQEFIKTTFNHILLNDTKHVIEFRNNLINYDEEFGDIFLHDPEDVATLFKELILKFPYIFDEEIIFTSGEILARSFKTAIDNAIYPYDCLPKSIDNKNISWQTYLFTHCECSPVETINFLNESPILYKKFQEDIQKNSYLFIVNNIKKTIEHFDILYNEQFDFKQKTKEGDTFFHTYFSFEDYFDEETKLISPEMHHYLKDNAYYFLNQKNKAGDTCFDMLGDSEMLTLYEYDGTKIKVSCKKYKAILKKHVINCELKNNIENKKDLPNMIKKIKI